MPKKSAKPKDPRKFESKALRRAVLDLEAILGAKVVTSYSEYRPNDPVRLGGSCSCCGASGRFEDDFDCWFVVRAGFTDSDGVFMSMLCSSPHGDGCYESIQAEMKKRPATLRDLAAETISELLGDDVDGAEAMMDDLDYMGMLDE